MTPTYRATYTFAPFDGQGWNDLLRGLPNAHILQSAEWGAFKAITDWSPSYFTLRDSGGHLAGGAMILMRRIGPAVMMYVPKGPALDYASLPALEAMLQGLEREARRRLAIQIKIDPDIVIGTGVPGEPDAQDDPAGLKAVEALRRRGWRFSAEQVQFRNTILIDLTRSEDELLAAMGQGKRRKVRYGARHGVTVRAGTLDDLPMLHTLYAETGARNGFITRPYAYYLGEWGSLMRAGKAHALIAEVNGQPVAHVILFHFGARCLYFTGASVSDNEVRKLMPADLLQWEAMRWAKAQGYALYDMWGAPNEFVESDRMWNVFQFKRDYGGTVIRTAGAWDFAPFPPLYTFYHRIMPRVLNVMRRRARQSQRADDPS